MKKTIIKFVMAVLVALFSQNANAYDAKINGIYYNIDVSNRVAMVTYGEDKYTGRVNIPTSIQFEDVDYNVTSIGPSAFQYSNELTRVSIPNSIISIESCAFLGCDGISLVKIPDSVISIGNEAFWGCSGLTSVSIGNSVTSIGRSAFEGCSKLSSVNIPNNVVNIDRDAFKSTSWFNNQLDGLVYAGNVAYKYKGTMPPNTNIIIQEGTTSISPAAFYNCSGLANVSIPNSVISIGDEAFYGCSSLTAIAIPGSITTIGYCVFQNCSGLTSVTIPNSVTSIGIAAFSGCKSLNSLTIPSSVTTIGLFAFSGCSGLNSIVIPDGVISIDGEAFKNCSNVTSVSIPNSVTSIGAEVFSGTSWYENQEDGLVYANNVAYKYKGTMPENAQIKIKEGTTLLGCGVFQNYKNLVSVFIPNSVVSVGDAASNGCSGLTSVIIPNSVISIGYSAFKNCSGLTSVIIPNSVTSIGEHAFWGCSELTSINIPKIMTSINASTFFGCKKIESVILPSGVTSISNGAFCYCKGLTSVIAKIKEPFEFGPQAFDEISTSCQLIVPEGEKNAYISKGWTTDVFKGGIVEAPYDPTTDNYLAIDNLDINKGKSIVLPVKMDNTESITALQFEIALPAGVTISKCQLTDRKGEDHTASCKKLTNGNYQVTVLSLSKAVFSGTEGALVNLTLDAADNMTADDYDISLTNIELTTADTQAINPADVTATLTVSDGFVAAAADVDGNGRITITDAVAVVDMILNGSASAKGRVGMDEEGLDPQ